MKTKSQDDEKNVIFYGIKKIRKLIAVQSYSTLGSEAFEDKCSWMLVHIF